VRGRVRVRGSLWVSQGRALCASPVTHLSCPDRGEQAVTGYADGMVMISCALSLVPLFSFYPHLHCATSHVCLYTVIYSLFIIIYYI
jgi:hypothetical protein